eukprot:3271896-Alexandrium_andersonii.AAC.1
MVALRPTPLTRLQTAWRLALPCDEAGQQQQDLRPTPLTANPPTSYAAQASRPRCRRCPPSRYAQHPGGKGNGQSSRGRNCSRPCRYARR